MYPAQTSLIPVQIALVRFLESQGWRAIFEKYPYWYLGTTPFRYLTGPILPSVLVILHRLLSNFSLFEIMFGLIAIGWVAGGVGAYFLVKTLMSADSNAEKHRLTPFLAAIFYAPAPAVPFLFRFSDGLYLIAFSFLPYILLLYIKMLKKFSPRIAILLCLLLSFVVLLDTSIISSVFLGMAAIFLAQVGWEKAEEKLKQTFLVSVLSFLVATLWYTPGYWLNSLSGPSLAGRERIGVIFQLLKLLPTALAFVMAIFSAKFFKKRDLLRDFCFYFLFIFGFLTLMRFISDPDFWLDWSSYNLELQMGLAILGGLVLGKTRRKIVLIFASILVFGTWLFMFNTYVLGTLQRNISQTVEYGIGRQLSKIAKPYERVFLSGTTAFWLNAFFDIPQVRGGVDQASVDPNWRKAVWELREGTKEEKSVKWLKELGVSYLVVHTEDSEEFYHDFIYPEKFEEAAMLKKIYEKDGDRIYQVLD